MTKIQMPEPVAYFYVNGSLEGVRRHKRSDLALPDATEEHCLITTDQAEAYAAAKVKEAQQWISVDDRLPDVGLLVLVYSPPQPGDWPDSIRIEFDYIDPESDDPIWHNHSEHYEHYSCVAKGGADCPMTGPSEKAPYTYWMPLPSPPTK